MKVRSLCNRAFANLGKFQGSISTPQKKKYSEMPEVAFCDTKEIILGGDREEEDDDFEGSVKRPKGVSAGT